MSEAAGRFAGLERFECRTRVVRELADAGLLEKTVPYRHGVGHCYRCKAAVEPNLSRQWFVRTQPLAAKAITAVREGRTRIIPETWAATYFDWLENIRDWCISRQIWWGHQIPAWTCAGCGEVAVAMEAPAACPKCGEGRLVQEEDVLDTWFSSALWPFSTMGWPEETPLLKTFYPTAVLVTGFDILFFWVARMMMMGLHFMQAVPFRDVYVHALVRDEDGQKMSKSKGNVIDPLEIVDRHGTDAFRFTLAAFAAQGRDVKMSEKRVEGYRHFINKIWNAARFALMHVDRRRDLPQPAELGLVDRWILARLNRATAETARALDAYRFNDAAAALYGFLWHEVCDWYLEAVKPALHGKLDDAARERSLAVLWRVLHDSLILLHPFIPFVTEEIWHKLPGTEGSIMRAAFPADGPTVAADPTAESEMGVLIGIISGIRTIRGEMGIPPGMALEAVIHPMTPAAGSLIDTHRELIANLARLRAIRVTDATERPKASATSVTPEATVFVPLEGIIDFARERERLGKELAKIDKELASVAKKLQNQDFLAKAAPEVVLKVRDQQQELLDKQRKIRVNLEKIREYDSAS
jgi:valyl-tRNA synthetase